MIYAVFLLAFGLVFCAGYLMGRDATIETDWLKEDEDQD
jgi:hypothetical protein